MSLTRRRFLGLTLAAATARAMGATESKRDSVVLVTNDEDPDLSLATIELRKLFLGYTMLHDGNLLHPVRNRSDARLDAVFLQHVVAMSADAYERRLLSMSLQQGRPRPIEVHSRSELVHQLQAARHVISFSWQSDVAQLAGTHVVKTLWRE
jgi:hypothetical protein